ncbi:MAG: lipoyl protein ligase domain-containing protein [Thermocrispum sp.]
MTGLAVAPVDSVAGALGQQVITVMPPTNPLPPHLELELVRDGLAALGRGGPSTLRLSQPRATAAFSRRDTRLPGHPRAMTVAAEAGFSLVIRPVGGHLAVYGESSVVVHLWAAHTEARHYVRERFTVLGNALAEALRSVGVDARLGPVPGEYCDGEFSVNDSGRTKLAGTGQRITRHGYLFSAVVMVDGAEQARDTLARAYAELELPFLSETVGCVRDSARGVNTHEVRAQIAAAFARVLPGSR